MPTGIHETSASGQETTAFDHHRRLQRYGASVLGIERGGRLRKTRRAARAVGILVLAPLLVAAHCDGKPHPGTDQSSQGGDVAKQPSSGAQLPPGGEACTGLNTVKVEFDCGGGVTGVYSESFGSGHFHVDDHGERVDGDDVPIPLYEEIDVNGTCVIIHHADEDELAAIRRYQQPCSTL